jgi:uncharacterized protein
MDLQQLRYQVLPALEETGAYAQSEGEYAIGETVYKGGEEYHPLSPCSYQLQFTNTGGAVLVGGQAHATMGARCSRCLEPAEFEVDANVEGFILLRDDGDTRGLEADEYCLVGNDGDIDLAPMIYAAVVSEMPQVVLCREDCRGLCPHCGTDLNSGSCGCADEPRADSPFAVLKDLSF